MSRLDRQFAQYRAAALRQPMTRANTLVIPGFDVEHGHIGLSVNK